MMEYEELREKIADILDKGDGDFDREGGCTPMRDFAEEQADEILSIIADKCWLKDESKRPYGIDLRNTIPSLTVEQILAIKDAGWRPVKEIKKEG